MKYTEQEILDKIKKFYDAYASLKEKSNMQAQTIERLEKEKAELETKVKAGLDYYRFDSKWYTEICNDESFKVSGHFRLQPYGDGTRRLIWINEFTKNGYHRKAIIDKVKDGEVSLT